MADFSDAEDRLLFQLAKTQLDEGHKIDWKRVWQGMRTSTKSQHQLQIRLKTLKRTYGTNLDGFPRRFFSERLHSRATSRIPIADAVVRHQNYAHGAVAEIFRSVSRQDLQAPRRTPDCHAGEISIDGVTTMLSVLPPLKATDVFLDIGSGIGNVIIQVAVETQVGICIGIEVQSQLALLSKSLISSARATYARLGKISVYEDDIRQISGAPKAAMQSSTIVFANNLVFEPSTNEALEVFVTSAPRLAHVITTQAVCGRHRDTCKREFCSVWHFRKSIPVSVSWSAKPHKAYWYTKTLS